MDYASMLVAGSLLIVCVALFYLWMRAESKARRR